MRYNRDEATFPSKFVIDTALLTISFKETSPGIQRLQLHLPISGSVGLIPPPRGAAKN